MTEFEIKSLLRKYLNGTCTKEEEKLVQEWWETLQYTEDWQLTQEHANGIHDTMLLQIKRQISSQSSPLPAIENKKEASPFIRWWAAAAILILAVAGYAVFFASKHKSKSQIQSLTAATNIIPGGNHAILSSGNKQMVLDTVKNGLLQETEARILKKDGLLDFSASAGNTVVYNTLTTPRGGQYQLVLADGSKVWLDAASSITFPTVFTGHKREVSITGQVYFEVVHNAAKPFEVRVNDQLIHDLGTSFNINAYKDEAVTAVSLSSGAVAIEAGGKAKIVLDKPGLQATFSAGKEGSISEADMQQVLAWKNGFFHLEGADIPAIMRQLNRWYDVETVYANGIPDGHISGEITRSTSINNVLRILQTSGINCKIEERKIIITQ